MSDEEFWAPFRKLSEYSKDHIPEDKPNAKVGDHDEPFCPVPVTYGQAGPFKTAEYWRLLSLRSAILDARLDQAGKYFDDTLVMEEAECLVPQ